MRKQPTKIMYAFSVIISEQNKIQNARQDKLERELEESKTKMSSGRR